MGNPELNELLVFTLPSQGKNGDIRGKFFRDSHLRNLWRKTFRFSLTQAASSFARRFTGLA
jgi:hypothetical protein